MPGAGVDLVCDLETEGPALPDNSADEFLASHVLEHLRNPLPLMAECWRIAKPGALFVARVPYGSSDDADEDPTHVRWRADYGFRGD